MVQMQTYLKVADNTGAKELMCLDVYKRQVKVRAVQKSTALTF